MLVALDVEVITTVLEDLDAAQVVTIVEDVAEDDISVLAVTFTGSGSAGSNEGFEGRILRVHGVS